MLVNASSKLTGLPARVEGLSKMGKCHFGGQDVAGRFPELDQ